MLAVRHELPPPRPPSPSLLAQYHASSAPTLPRPAEWHIRAYASKASNFEHFGVGKEEAASDGKSDLVAKDSLSNLLRFCLDFEKTGRDGECAQFCAPRKLRGLDFLYSCQKENQESNAEVKEVFSGSPSPQRRRSSLRSFGMRSPLRSPTSLQMAAQNTPQWRNTRLQTRQTTFSGVEQRMALALLRQAPFFQNLEKISPGLTAQLTTGSTFCTEVKGQVVFRQGDPPESCYVVAAGEVEICIIPSDEDPPQQALSARRAGPATPRDEHDAGMCMTLTEMVNGVDRMGLVNRKRYSAREGGSTFTASSTLGPTVMRLGPGGVFGELALQNSNTRSGSVRCRTECTFLTISKQQYKRAMNKLIKKQKFISEHLPGMAKTEYKSGQIHPSSLFLENSYPEGYKFMSEGISAMEAAIFVVHEGTIRLSRYSHPVDNPAYMYAKRPLVGAMPQATSAASQRSSGSSICSRTGALGEPQQQPLRQKDFTVDTLGEGSVFSTLPTFPFCGVEPFTAVVTSADSRIYHIADADIVSLAPKVLRAIRSHLIRAMAHRLRDLLPRSAVDLASTTATLLPSELPALSVAAGLPGTPGAEAAAATLPRSPALPIAARRRSSPSGTRRSSPAGVRRPPSSGAQPARKGRPSPLDTTLLVP